MTPESVQAMIDQALLQNSTNRDGSHSSHEDNRRNMQTARPCFYADFMKWERLARCTAPAALPSPPLPPPLYMPPPVDRCISETRMPPRKRLCLSTLGSRYEMQQTEIAELRETDHRHQAQMAETLRVMGDMRREMGDMQAELLALREQPRRAGQPGRDARVPNHQDASRDADSHI
nr:hypothetical protein [Tanacetum cinerariifolium]